MTATIVNVSNGYAVAIIVPDVSPAHEGHDDWIGDLSLWMSIDIRIDRASLDSVLCGKFLLQQDGEVARSRHFAMRRYAQLFGKS